MFAKAFIDDNYSTCSDIYVKKKLESLDPQKGVKIVTSG